MPTGSNQVILNAAEIAAAQAAERDRQIRLNAARREEERLAGLVPFAQRVTELAPGLTQTLQARGGESAERGLGTTAKAVQTQKETVLDPYANIGNVIAGLSTPIPIPSAVYGATGSTGTSEAQSAYDLLYEQFSQYGLGALIEPLKEFIQEGISPAEFTIRLRNTDAYQKRFAANAQRIAGGLRALTEAEYIKLEDQYQNIMRNYGLPESYYARGDMGRQEGFEKFIAGDVSATELEDRIQTAQNRVINAAPEIGRSLKQFYPDITDGDILAYVLDPKQAISNIKRKVTAGEIQGAANMAGLNMLGPNATAAEIEAARMRAEELGRYGVTAETARKGFQTVADVVPRGSQLSQFYKESPYTQATAEAETFGLAGATEAAKQRKKLTQLEQASFAGRAGATGGALARDRAGSF